MYPIKCTLIATTVWLLAAETPTFAADLPGSWGVNVQTLYHEPALKSLGAQWARITLSWPRIEHDSTGHYDWTDSDKAINYYSGNGFHIVGLLAAEQLNPLYASSESNKEAVVGAVARWMTAAAQRYKGKGIIWEIGNEPESFPMGGFWDHPQIYVDLARRAATAMKRADPTAKVAVLSLAWMDRGYAQSALNAGLLADGNIDYLSFHGYHRKSIEPESGLEDDVNWLRSAAAAANTNGKPAPVVIDTETGYSIIPFESPKTKTGWRLSVYTEDTQAAYLARHYLEEIYLGIPISIWYKDMNGETDYSLYYSDEKGPKGLRPMGHMYQNLAKLMPDSPASIRNDRYQVSIAASSSQSWTGSGPELHQRSYLRQSGTQPVLLIAVWNAVEAFDGKILASRTFEANQVLEKWRDVEPNDPVNIPSAVQIQGLNPAAVQSAQVITFPHGNSVQEALSVAGSAGANTLPLSLKVTVGPTPTIISITLRATPMPPSNVTISDKN